MRFSLLWAATISVATLTVHAQPLPIKIGVTTILSGPTADRGQSEQYGVELALQQINQAGGVLNRPIQAHYIDNAANVDTGVQAIEDLIEKEHVSVVIGALATPVTRALMPIAEAKRVPLVIDISAGDEFVNVAGTGGYRYTFKTSPSNSDVALALMDWLKANGTKSIGIIGDDVLFNKENLIAMRDAAASSGIAVKANQTVLTSSPDFTDFLREVEAERPDQIVVLLGPTSDAFLRAYENARLDIPLTGRLDYASAKRSFSRDFLVSGRFDKSSSVTTFFSGSRNEGIQNFVSAYKSKYGLMPNQRAAFAFEATYLIADAIRAAGDDTPSSVRSALQVSSMPSMFGKNFSMDEHNHSHTSLTIVGMRHGIVEQLNTKN
jgi:branched-chain amino acid transport system substrate-binding protein